MIRIRLYSGCILDDKYKNVFSKALDTEGAWYSPFSDYLNNLTQVYYEIDNVYQDEMTSLNFKLSSNDYTSIYKFNYMKIESVNENNEVTLTRYAFITSIKIGNDIARISYKIDIWHTYIDNVKGLNIGILKGLRVVNGTGGLKIPTYRKLPINYAGNNELIFNHSEVNYTENKECAILIQVQIYTTAQFGESTPSTTKYFLISSYRYDYKVGDLWNHMILTPKVNTVDTIIETIINLYGEKNFMEIDDTSVNAYYKIGKIYIVPSSFSSLFNTPQHMIRKRELPAGVIKYYSYYLSMPKSSSINLNYITTYTINNNYLIKGIGLKSLFVPVEVNGSSINFSLYAAVSQTAFSFVLSAQNKFIDITSNFEYFPVTTQISGNVLAQQRISRAIQNLEDMGRLLRNAGKMSNSIYRENIGGITDSIANIGDTAIERAARNMPIYNTSDIVKVNNNALSTYTEGFGYYTSTADNTNYVKDTINTKGYEVFEYLYNFNNLGITTYAKTFRDAGIYYNVIKVENSIIYGDFPLDIAKTLSEILANGIKIWYHNNINYALDHDTYAVG